MEQKVVDLWEAGEKVLVFAFYRQTCAALRIHISDEIERRTTALAKRRLAPAELTMRDAEVDGVLRRIQDRYFDVPDAPGRKSLDRSLRSVVVRRRGNPMLVQMPEADLARAIDVMRRFLRVRTTLVRCFPLGEYEGLEPAVVVERMLDNPDGSKMTWRQKLEAFVDFIVT